MAFQSSPTPSGVDRVVVTVLVAFLVVILAVASLTHALVGGLERSPAGEENAAIDLE